MISYREIAKALDKSIIRIEDSVMETLSQTPPELAADIYNTGVYLAGGGSMLRGLDKRLSQKTDLPILSLRIHCELLFVELVSRLKILINTRQSLLNS